MISLWCWLTFRKFGSTVDSLFWPLRHGLMKGLGWMPQHDIQEASTPVAFLSLYEELLFRVVHDTLDHMKKLKNIAFIENTGLLTTRSTWPAKRAEYYSFEPVHVKSNAKKCCQSTSPSGTGEFFFFSRRFPKGPQTRPMDTPDGVSRTAGAQTCSQLRRAPYGPRRGPTKIAM